MCHNKSVMLMTDYALMKACWNHFKHLPLGPVLFPFIFRNWNLTNGIGYFFRM
jgi:hypothetical protein